MFPSPSLSSFELWDTQAISVSAIFRLLERFLAAFAAYDLLLRCYGSYRNAHSWWCITFPWWRREFLRTLLRSMRLYPSQKSRSEFHYQPLRHGYIRLFILEPGFWFDPIRGHFVEVPLLENAPQYEALSYCWGHRVHNDVVEISESRLRIGENLSDALRHLRRTQAPRTLWADAICINQQDYLEKSVQVSLMSQIYRNAEAVQIWLGKETPSSAAGMEVLAFLAGSMNIGQLWMDSLCNEKRVSGLKDIMSRPWLERAWVVQESALSKKATLNVGYQTLSWDESTSFRFLKRIKFAEVTPEWRRTVQVDMGPLRELLELGLRATNRVTHALSPDLLDVVHDMRHRKATNDVDRIYSVLALVPDGMEFRVDYGATPGETFERLYHHIRSKYKDQWEDNADTSTSARLLDIWHTLFGSYDHY